jgi:hypothetical protein
MQPVLFDASIYISALRIGNEAALTWKRLAANSPPWPDWRPSMITSKLDRAG